MKEVALKYGLAYSYYIDSHSIFRFVQGRDSFWRKHYKVTDEADPQWKQALDDLRVKLIYALSPQAKGKIERPYGWLKDRPVSPAISILFFVLSHSVFIVVYIATPNIFLLPLVYKEGFYYS